MEVQKAISQLIAGRTVIVIAHRLKTIKDADNIIVMEDGRVAEQGTHGELIAKNGLYKKLRTIQSKSSEWEI